MTGTRAVAVPVATAFEVDTVATVTDVTGPLDRADAA